MFCMFGNNLTDVGIWCSLDWITCNGCCKFSRGEWSYIDIYICIYIIKFLYHVYFHSYNCSWSLVSISWSQHLCLKTSSILKASIQNKTFFSLKINVLKIQKLLLYFLSYSSLHPHIPFSYLHTTSSHLIMNKRIMSNHIGSFKGNVCCLYNPTHNLASYIRTLKESFDLSFLLDSAAETTLIALQYVTPYSKPSFLIAHKLGHSKPFTIWLPPSLPGLFLTTYTILLPTTHHYGNKSCLFLPLCFCSNLFFLEHSWDLSNSSVN